MAKRISLVSLSLFLFSGAGEAWAQQRSIGGRVTSALTGEALAGATVAVVGTAIVAVTTADGSFSLAAPPTDVALVVRLIGYKRRQVAVTPGQSQVDVALQEDIFNLEAIVVTGQATAVEKRNLANAVSTVEPAQLVRVPTPTLETALQGKIPGALIQQNSGAPGGGVQINLRGVSTINGSVDPIIVVDGLIISNVAILNGMNGVSAAGAGGNPSPQDNPVNRIADLNPADIERVEILKGASAAAIYGAQASNGVIIITTRRGTRGAPRFQITQRVGTFDLAHKIGSRTFRDSAEAVATFGPSAAPFCSASSCPAFDNEELLYGRNDLSSETIASVSGGTELTRYFVSGLVKHDAGIAENTGYEKQSVRANLDQRLSPRFELGVNLNVIHSTSNRAISNNDNTGTSPYLVFPFTPNFVDLSPTGPLISDYPDNPFERSNPLQTFAFLRNEEDVWRGLGTATVEFDAVATDEHRLRILGTGGLDFFNQRNDILSPPDLEFEPQDGQPGTIVLGKAENVNLNLAGHITHTYTPASGKYIATTSAGFQFRDRNLNQTSILGRGFLSGQGNVDQASSQSPAQDIQHARGLGLYAQEEVLLLDQRLLLTFGVRADRSSTNGDPDKYFYYPKGAASYRFLLEGGDEIKLRAALGQTGNEPLFGVKFTPDSSGIIGGRFGTFVGTRAGDPGIKPERQMEFEAGVDATLLQGRVIVNLTAYQKTITDLLLERQLAPSTGQLTEVFNGGELRNRGFEAAVGYSLLQSANLSWLVRVTFFKNTSKVIDLPVPAFRVGGFGTALGVFTIEEGKSATQIIGTDSLGTPGGLVVGDATPDFQMAFSSDVEYGPWTLGFLFDWKKGGDVINLTELLFDAGANSDDFVSAGDARFQAWIAGQTSVYVQDASYLKLRELTLSYQLPASVAASLLGAGSAVRLSLSGRNLLRFTPFRGIDPEVSNFGNQAVARNIDVAPFPPSRSYFFSVDVSF